MKSTLLMAIAMSALLAGCAPVLLVKDGATQRDYDYDMRDCEYDAVKYGSGYDATLRTSIGQGIEQGLRQRDIKMACMKSKGWRPKA